MKRLTKSPAWCLGALLVLSGTAPLASASGPAEVDPAAVHMEVPDDPYIEVPRAAQITEPARIWERNGHLSVQVNVSTEGDNILGDAANEPSIAVDPTHPNRIAIGWRQFDTIASNFRQAGRGYSNDGGRTWTFPGVLDPGVFRSDPVLDFDSAGNFFYDSLEGSFCTSTYMSTDGGQSWDTPVFSHGGDKQWIGIDRSGGTGDGHIYHMWNSFFDCPGGNGGDFNRSTDGGLSFESPVTTPTGPVWGVTAVGPSGDVYVVGNANTAGGYSVVKSTTLDDPGGGPNFTWSNLDLGGPQSFQTGPNPSGLLGQVWIAADPTDTTGPETVYVLSSVNPPGGDPLDIHFVHSIDGGSTFSSPVRVNDDPSTSDWQWFGTMSVAPNGRIDAIWNDTRNGIGLYDSELFYSYSMDGGLTWSPNLAVSPSFNPHLGWPQQNKIGDYYDMVSDEAGAHIAYSATFNGEQDVYYLRILTAQVFSDTFESGDTSLWGEIEP